MASSLRHQMRCVGFLCIFIAMFRGGRASDYVGCSFMSTCDVMNALTAEMERQRPTKELQAIKSKMDQLVDMEYEFSGLKFDFLLLKEEFEALRMEVNSFTKDQKAKAEELKIDDKQQNRVDKHEERVKKVEDKLNKLLDGNGIIKSLQEEVETLKKELVTEKTKQTQIKSEKAEQDKKLQAAQAQLVNLQVQLTQTQKTLDTYHGDQKELTIQLEDLKRVKDQQEHLHIHINDTSKSSETLIQDLESHLKDSISSIVELTENKTAENRYKLRQLASLLSNQSDSIELLQEFVRANEEQLNETAHDLLAKIREKVDIVEVEHLASITSKVFAIANATSKNYQQLTKKFEESVDFWIDLEDKVNAQAKNYNEEVTFLKRQLTNREFSNKQTSSDLSSLKTKVENIEMEQNEVIDKLGDIQDAVEKIQVSLATEKPQMDKKLDKQTMTEESTIRPPHGGNTPHIPLSCMYYKLRNEVIASINGRPITSQMLAVPDGQVITFRCSTAGAYRLQGSVVRQCSDGKWIGDYPVCGPLVSMAEIEARNVSLDATPSIIIDPEPDSSTTGVLPDGNIIVTPGSKITLSCLFPDGNKLQWTATTSNSHQPQIIFGEWNPDKSSLDISITTARASNSRQYTCGNKDGGNNTVTLLVKSVTCEPPISNDVIKVSRNSNNVMNSEIHLQCTTLSHYMLWPDEEQSDSSSRSRSGKLTCLPSGVWSRDWPTCSKIELIKIN